MRFRGKSIRRKIVVLLLVPLVSLVSIWAFATYVTGRDAARLLADSQAMNRVNGPVAETTRALQRERRQTLVYLADPRSSDALSILHQQQRATDRAVDEVRDLAREGGLRDRMRADAVRRMDDFLDGLIGLEDVRTRTEKNALTRGAAFQAYNEFVDPAFTLLDSLHGMDEPGPEREGRALVGLSRAREYLAREDALMAAALAAGRMTRGDQRAFSDRIAERNLAFGTYLPLLPAEDRQTFENYWNTTDGRTLRGYEDAVIAAGSRGATDVLDAARWREATSAVLDDLQRLRFEAHERYQDRLDPAATGIVVKAAAAGVLGFAAVVASLVVSVRVGRGLVRDLSALRKEAHESAGVRLPSVMRRLAAGEQVDVETEAPLLEYPQDETGQVGRALNTLQRAAVEAAVKQAGMRRGVSEVFVNLARRNQVLLHRQLTLLDAMERRTEDADELADLFRLDHLTTRMRRHAEGLVILSGAAPSRQWRKPVQLMDVVRAAVAEVEDYERIEVRRLPRLAVDGGAVADLTHLVAELLENATVFSPPHTAVQVLGERVPNGFTLEIHDRGLGMPADQLLDANLRLAETPEFELSDTDRLGLFVVSRLAQRQRVRVSLQPSPYGGTTAVVLIPGSVLTEPADRDGERDPAAVTAGGGDDGTSERDGRVAALAPASAPLLESGSRRTPALDGPIELEAPLDDLGDLEELGGLERLHDTEDDSIFRRRGDSGRGTAEGGPQRRARPGPHPLTGGRRRTGDDRGGDGPATGDGHGDAHRAQGGRAPHTAGPSHGPAAAGDGPSGERTHDAEETGPAPLPRRRPGAPVLVSDHGRPVDETRRRREPGDGATRTAGPAGSPESAAEDGPGAAGGTTAGRPRETGPPTVGGLPRRVRQASLAPQLRTSPEEDGAARDDDHATGARPDDRDAEAVRSRMSSLQRGWQRGRQQQDEPPAEPADTAGDPAPGTTPEGERP
ncbi:nitrate- and nitrite sensing domain-containing protein [Streptomyces sp. JJ36]|uniref:sensor histidine kinase n=1 Tax=Streptomyces sp. JJ36 TaxID=2736645 RepID=UPI001F33EC65|nr:nitrate- and nitrite sensing domain-containing protein [Streptomyces sp. JJ36]MCF6525422.1 nitrate- and nitrite sensing domain-containing protein [Streptomyces sp. JJ36]